MMALLASLSLLLPPLQATDTLGASWDKIVTALESRIRGNDLSDRVKATQDVTATKDVRAFELLARSLSWARAQKRPLDEAETENKKNLNALRDSHAARTKERHALLSKKKLSAADTQKLQDLGAEIAGLDRSMKAVKAGMEKNKAESLSFQQVESTALAGFAELLRGAAPGLFEKYRKALASALDFPGAISQGPTFVQALVQSGRKEGYPALEEILKNALGSEALFLEAAKGMTTLDSAAAIPDLIPLLGFPNSSVRKAVHEALKAVTNQSLPPERSAWEAWRKSTGR